MKEKLLERNFKLIQETNVGDKIVYTFEFDAKFYSLFGKENKDFFLSSKLFF